MALTVTDLRTIWDEADAATWDGSSADSLFTSIPSPVELTGCLGIQVSESTDYTYFTGTAVNMSAGVLVYIWVRVQGAFGNTETGGIQVLLGDGTDRIGFHVAGNDVAGFRHDVGPVGWQNVLVDTAELPTAFTTDHTGLLANLTYTAITDIGAAYVVGSKSVGGAENCFNDIVRYGNWGLSITGGDAGDPGTFFQIANEDRKDISGQAHGLFREYSTNTYGTQGPLNFGDLAAGDTWFTASGSSVTFENRDIADDRYYIATSGGSGETHFTLDAISMASAGPAVVSNFSLPNVDTLSLTNCSFTNLQREMDFSIEQADGSGSHVAINNIFTGVGQIKIGTVSFTDNTILNSTAADGALHLDVSNVTPAATNFSDLTFTSGSFIDLRTHAIYITDPGTYPFDNMVFTNYGLDETTDAAVYNNSGGNVIIDVTNGSAPTVRNGTSATTTVLASIPLAVNVIDEDGNAVFEAQVGIFTDPGGSQLMNKDTDGSGDAATTYGGSTPQAISIRVRKSSTGATKYFPNRSSGNISETGFSSTVTIIEDAIASA